MWTPTNALRLIGHSCSYPASVSITYAIVYLRNHQPWKFPYPMVPSQKMTFGSKGYFSYQSTFPLHHNGQEWWSYHHLLWLAINGNGSIVLIMSFPVLSKLPRGISQALSLALVYDYICCAWSMTQRTLPSSSLVLHDIGYNQLPGLMHIVK